MIATIKPASSNLLDDESFRRVEMGFRSGLPVGLAIERHLRGVVGHTLQAPGSLARAQLTYWLFAGFGYEESKACDLGVAVEYFHTASLLLDDLPCMDNANQRRGRACAHTLYGESSAILGALALINQGYALLWRVLGNLPEPQRIATHALVTECLGLGGILNGQAFDLNFRDSAKTKSDVMRIAHGKTVQLIRLTLLLPVMVHGVAAATQQSMEELSVAWGLAYQILDDFKDIFMNEAESGKTSARDHSLNHPNLPVAMGVEAAATELDHQLETSRRVIAQLARQLPDVSVLTRLQDMLEGSRTSMRSRMSAGDVHLDVTV